MKKSLGRKERRKLANEGRNLTKHKATTKPHSVDAGSRLKMLGLSKPRKQEKKEEVSNAQD